MNEDKARELAAYLGQLPAVRSVRPVKVRIGKEEFFGVRFRLVHRYQVGERAVTDGGKRAGDEWEEVRLDLLGPTPKTYRRKRVGGMWEQAVVYRLPGDDSDWYIGGYYPGPEPNEYHPQGRQFSLHRWPHENPWHGRIDHYDEKPRERLAIEVEELA